jgi:hypothetical protein
VLTLPSAVRIHLAAKAVDFRKGHQGLYGVIRNDLAGDPVRHVWVFYNSRRTDLNVMWFEHGGFVLAHKKLARGRVESGNYGRKDPETLAGRRSVMREIAWVKRLVCGGV